MNSQTATEIAAISGAKRPFEADVYSSPFGGICFAVGRDADVMRSGAVLVARLKDSGRNDHDGVEMNAGDI